MQRLAWQIVLLALIATPISAAVQKPGDLPGLKTRVRTVAAFKNGLGFIFRSGETKLDNGWALMEQVPPAVLGGFWVGTTAPGARVDKVVSFRRKIKAASEPTTLPDLLSAAVGKKVLVTYTVGAQANPSVVSGIVLSVPLERKRDSTELPSVSRDLAHGYRSGYPSNPLPPADGAPGQIVIIKTTDNRLVAINKNSIQSVELTGSVPPKATSEYEVSSAKLHLNGAQKSAEITLAYLEKGITWSPSYLINIADEKQADITLEAVFANDMEDLEDTDVSFVVGYPNFMFADMLNPLSLQQSVAAFVGELMLGTDRTGQGGYGGVMAQSRFQNTVGYNNGSANAWSPETAYSANNPMPGESNEDLYFYQQRHVTLKKGDKARYTVFTASVPYEHIYQWDIPDSMNLDDRGYRLDPSRAKDPADQVWHAVRLKNTSKQPWTTAPAFAVNSAMPIAQDVLKYTPSGGKNTLRLTVATDVTAEQVQTEASRKELRIGTGSYDEVTVDGKLFVKNWKKKTVKINVKKSLIGEVLSNDGGGRVSKVIKKVTSVNPTSEIEWEFNLAPGIEKKLSYQYKIYVGR